MMKTLILAESKKHADFYIRHTLEDNPINYIYVKDYDDLKGLRGGKYICVAGWEFNKEYFRRFSNILNVLRERGFEEERYE